MTSHLVRQGRNRRSWEGAQRHPVKVTVCSSPAGVCSCDQGTGTKTSIAALFVRMKKIPWTE